MHFSPIVIPGLALKKPTLWESKSSAVKVYLEGVSGVSKKQNWSGSVCVECISSNGTAQILWKKTDSLFYYEYNTILTSNYIKYEDAITGGTAITVHTLAFLKYLSYDSVCITDMYNLISNLCL